MARSTWAQIGRALLGLARRGATEALKDELDKATRQQSRHAGTRERTSASGGSHRPAQAAHTRVLDLSSGLPALTYDPHPDGDPDPGEVCWAWVPYEEDPSRGKDRPVLVVGRMGNRFVLAQMTSKDHDHDAAYQHSQGREWMDVGTGAWESRRRPSEVRLDRLLLADAQGIRREGATLAKDRFDAVVARLRQLHG